MRLGARRNGYRQRLHSGDAAEMLFPEAAAVRTFSENRSRQCMPGCPEPER